MIFAGHPLLNGAGAAYHYTGESLLYLISPVGKAEYNDLGPVDLKGVKVNLVIFKTKVLFFEVMEKIYIDPESLLPYRIERTISKLWLKEYTTEEYDQEKFIVAVRKFKGVKLVSEQIVKASGPIQNAVILAYYLRSHPGFEIGWHFTANVPTDFKSVPTEFMFELVSIDEITVPAGKFKAYHLRSTPPKFEIWINKNNPRVPLKIKGKGGFNFALLMRKYSPPHN
jgi:hypothetical protein